MASNKRERDGDTSGFISPEIFSEATIRTVRGALFGPNASPFPHGAIPSFVRGDLVEEIAEAAMSQNFAQLSTDLYDLLQTDDLSKLSAEEPPVKKPRDADDTKKNGNDDDGDGDGDGDGDNEEASGVSAEQKAKAGRVLARLRDEIYSERFVSLMESITGLELERGKTDFHALAFRTGGHLLCHDDQLEGRAIAFILYLVSEDWEAEKDGGCLELYDCDAKGDPKEVVKAIPPVRNNLAFFPVSPVTHHRVAEVTGDLRISVSGWFYLKEGSPAVRDVLEREIAKEQQGKEQVKAAKEDKESKTTENSDDRDGSPPPEQGEGWADVAVESSSSKGEGSDSDSNSDSVAAWIQPSYLKKAVQERAQAHFAEESSIELQDFLIKDRYVALEAELTKSGNAITWTRRGPANRRWYETVPDDVTVAPQATSLRRMLRSKEFSDFIEAITGLNPWRAHVEPRRFTKGDYTLLRDSLFAEEGLDVVIGVNRCLRDAKLPSDSSDSGVIDEWDADWGGTQTYVSKKEALITQFPTRNAASIVFRERGTAPFVKYLHARSPHTRFDVLATYVERPEDRNNDPVESSEDELPLNYYFPSENGEDNEPEKK